MAVKTVLVTRPTDQAGGILDAIKQQGGTPVHAPLLCMVGLTLSHSAKQVVLNLDSYDRVIFISGPSVSFGMEWIENYWPQLPVSITWFAVGKATARRLQPYHIDVLTPEIETSEGLLSIPLLTEVTGLKILIVRGVGGRETLAESLRSRGAQVDYLETYQRGREPWREGDLAALILQHQLEWIMITSGAALEYLTELLRGRPLDCIKLILPSARVVSMAESLGYQSCYLADGADDESMLAAWQKYQKYEC